MAVESVTQVMKIQSVVPHGYLLQNVKISSAMVLREQAATEVVFDVRMLHDIPSKELRRGFSFKVSSVSASNEWVEHASGEIFAELIDMGMWPSYQAAASALTLTKCLSLQNQTERSSSSKGFVEVQAKKAMTAVGIQP